jgi:hypothetical protein
VVAIEVALVASRGSATGLPDVGAATAIGTAGVGSSEPENDFEGEGKIAEAALGGSKECECADDACCCVVGIDEVEA